MSPPATPDRRQALVALGISSTLLPLAAAAATPTGPTTTAPGAPTSLFIQIEGETSPGSGVYNYTASWSAPVDDGGAEIDLYEHGLWNNADQNLVSGTQLVTSTSYVEDPDNPATFRVRARNSVGWGPYAQVAAPVLP